MQVEVENCFPYFDDVAVRTEIFVLLGRVVKEGATPGHLGH